MTGFLDDVIFPVSISRGSAGGPDWPAQIVGLSNGREERNTRWSAPLRSYDAAYSVRTANEMYEILSLYHVAMGRLYGFRLLDWTDYRSGAPGTVPTALDQVLGTGDGVTSSFQLQKTYSFAGHTFRRTITKPYGTTLVAIDGAATGAGWSVDTAAGLVTFDVAPADGAALTWGGQFHVPVRFDCQLTGIDLQGPYENLPSILLRELRL